MFKITVQYGIETQDAAYPTPPTVRQIKTDHNLRAILGYSDNVRVLLSGVELPDNAIIPTGSLVSIETAANKKAVLA